LAAPLAFKFKIALIFYSRYKNKIGIKTISQMKNTVSTIETLNPFCRNRSFENRFPITAEMGKRK